MLFEAACRYGRGAYRHSHTASYSKLFCWWRLWGFGWYWLMMTFIIPHCFSHIFHCMSKIYVFPGVLLSLCVEVESCSWFLYSPFMRRPILPWQKRLRGWCWLLLLPGGTRLPYRSSIASMATSGLWRDDGSIIWGDMEIHVQTSLVTSWTAFANWDDSISYPPWK